MENKISYWEAPVIMYQFDETRVKTDNIIADVCQVYGIELADLISKRRHRILVEPRQVLFYILHKKLNIPCVTVGKMFNKNHATVLHGAKNILNWMDNDQELSKRVNGVMIRNDYFALSNKIETSNNTIYKR